MAALSVFFMQSPSFPAHQRALAEGRARSNAHTPVRAGPHPLRQPHPATARRRHNFGHGKDTLASALAVLNLLAFALHGACELAETPLAARPPPPRHPEHLRTVTEYQVFPDWNALLSLLATGGTASQPP